MLFFPRLESRGNISSGSHDLATGETKFSWYAWLPMMPGYIKKATLGKERLRFIQTFTTNKL